MSTKRQYSDQSHERTHMKASIVVLLLLIAAPLSAQTHECDQPSSTIATVEAGKTVEFAWCHDGKDTNSNPTTVTWNVYRNNVLTPVAVTAGTTTNGAGLRQYKFQRPELVVGDVVYQVTSVNSLGESARLSFPSLSVTPARTGPTAPVKGSSRVVP